MKFKKQHDALLTPGFFLFSLFSNIDGFLWDLNWTFPVSLSFNYLYMFALLLSNRWVRIRIFVLPFYVAGIKQKELNFDFAENKEVTFNCWTTDAVL